MYATTRARLLPAALTSLALLASCASSPATPDAPDRDQPSTAATRPTPSPTPQVDVAAAFIDAIEEAGDNAILTMTGSMEAGPISAQVSGEARLTAEGSATIFRIEASNGYAATEERITLGDDQYLCVNGLWILQPRTAAPAAPAPEEMPASPGGVLPALTAVSLEDPQLLRVSGSETIDGDEFVRLVAVDDTQLTPAAVGFHDPGMADAELDVVFLAREDGTPVGMLIDMSWTDGSEVDAMPVSLDLDIRFERLGGWLRLEAPSPAWEMYESADLRYAIAHPVGWAFERTPETAEAYAIDSFRGEYQQLSVSAMPDVGASMPTSVIFAYAAEYLAEEFGAEVESWEDLDVDGHPARLIRSHYTDPYGTTVFYQDVIVVGEEDAWEIAWVSLPGAEESERRTFENLLATFTATEG